MNGATDRPLIVGSWPGPSFGTNDFVRLYARALESAGCRVVDLPNVLQLRDPIDVLHIHWPEQLLWQGGSVAIQTLRVMRALRLIARLRRQGTKIVWMVHNLRPHERRGARRFLWALIERFLPVQVDGIMTLSPATLPMVTTAFPGLRDKPAAAVAHPAYPAVRHERAAARATLGIAEDAQVLAMLGFLRPYKGAEALLTAFKALPDERRGPRRLVIAGHCGPEYATSLAALAGDDPRITLITRALADEELAAYTTAANWIVLPFRDYLHSGSMVHALSFSRPVVTPRAPFAEDLASLTGKGSTRLYEGPLTPAILAALPVDAPAPDLSRLQPAAIGAAALHFYRSLGAGR